MNIKELRELTETDLGVKLKEAKDELFRLRFQLALRQLDNTSRLGELRNTIAQVHTVRRERELAASGSIK
jgi:large subunit ribosomal protein L29